MFGKMFKMIKMTKEVKEYYNRLIKMIEKLEIRKAVLGELFLTTENEEVAYEYNDQLVRTINVLDDLRETKRHIEETGNVVEYHSCKWFVTI